MHLAIHKYIYPTYFAIENEQLGPKTALETLKTPRKSKPSRGNPTDDEWRTAIAIETDLELNDAKKKRSEDVGEYFESYGSPGYGGRGTLLGKVTDQSLRSKTPSRAAAY